VGAALAAGAEVHTFLVTPAAAERHGDLVAATRSRGAEVLTVADRVMAALASTVTPQGVVALTAGVARPIAELPAHPRLVCVLDQVADPGNVGTVLRTADAAGADALVTTAGSARLESPKAVRASAGSLFHLPVFDGVPWPQVRAACADRGLTLVGADAHAPVTVDQAPLAQPCALVLGSEAHGLSDQVRRDCDRLVRLPVDGRAESLNLASAAAILLYEAARQARGPRADVGEDVARG
jgi:TrmH family RNA methyltransferase